MQKTTYSFLTLLCFVGASSLAIGQSYVVPDFNYSEADDPKIVISNATHPTFTGYDDTFTGQVDFNFTWASPPGLDSWNLANSIWYLTQFFVGETEGAFVGNGWGNANWSYYGNGTDADLLDSGGNPVKPNSANPIDFGITINFVAGSDDTATVHFLGAENILGAGDYSFDNIRVRGLGNDHAFSSVSITAVPEPATAGFALGSLALLAMIVRRRIKR